MRYITLDTNTLYHRLVEHVRTIAEANADLLDIPTIVDLGFEIPLPYCERDAWEGEEEDVLVPLGFLSIYYQKVNDPNEKDLRPRQLMPIETYESKAGDLLMKAYDLNAGFVKSFRLDAVQRILIRNQNLSDDGWGLQDITFRGRGALTDGDLY